MLYQDTTITPLNVIDINCAEIMADPLLEARNLTKNYGQVRALDGASFTVFPGEVVGDSVT